MSNQKLTQAEVKEVIANKIGSGIEFRVLRKELKGVSRRDIKLLVLEIMAEQQISEVPFPGMLKKPNKATPPLSINPDGTLDIKEILEKKSFMPDSCLVKYTIGAKKITMTIKEIKNTNNTEKSAE